MPPSMLADRRASPPLRDPDRAPVTAKLTAHPRTTIDVHAHQRTSSPRPAGDAEVSRGPQKIQIKLRISHPGPGDAATA